MNRGIQLAAVITIVFHTKPNVSKKEESMNRTKCIYDGGCIFFHCIIIEITGIFGPLIFQNSHCIC